MGNYQAVKVKTYIRKIANQRILEEKMPKGKKCLVKYCKTYESMRQTSLEVMQIICKDYLPSYEYLKSKFPDEAANRGGRFIKHPAIIKKESDLEEFEKSPHSRFFL